MECSWSPNVGPIVLKYCAPIPSLRSCSRKKGLSIQNKVIDLSEPGLGKVKVAVDDAPMNLDNNTIRDVLTSYGKVLDVRYDYLYVDGNRVPWWNGTRHVDMCELKSELPPTIKVRHGQKHIKIKLWHKNKTLAYWSDAYWVPLVQRSHCQRWT